MNRRTVFGAAGVLALLIGLSLAGIAQVVGSAPVAGPPPPPGGTQIYALARG